MKSIVFKEPATSEDETKSGEIGTTFLRDTKILLSASQGGTSGEVQIKGTGTDLLRLIIGAILGDPKFAEIIRGALSITDEIKGSGDLEKFVKIQRINT